MYPVPVIISTRWPLLLTVIVDCDAVGKRGISFIHIVLVDGHVDGLPLPDEDHLRLGSGDSCIKQVPPKHDVMFLQDGDQDNRKFCALALMDADAVREVNILQHISRVVQHSSVQQCDFDDRIIRPITRYRSDHTNFAICHFFLVPGLNDPVPDAIGHTAALDFGSAGSGRIDQVSDLTVQAVGTYSSLLPLWGEDLHISNAVLGNLLDIVLQDQTKGFIAGLYIAKNEVVAIEQVRVVVIDRMCIQRDPMSSTAVGIIWLRIISLSTLPGPTDGSWSGSPTKIS